MNAPAAIKPRYATKAKIRLAVETARELGLDVAGFTLAPDGAIQVIEARAMPKPQDLFDQLEEAGKL